MKKTILFLTLITAFFMSSFTKSGELFAHIDKMYYLQGKVGEKSIFVKIKCYDEFPVRYMHCFFDNNKRDQFFIGTLKGNAWEFISGDNPNQTRTLTIKEAQNGIWNGSFTDGTGKQTNISLKPLQDNPNLNHYQFSRFHNLDPYEACKMSKVDLLKVNTKIISKDFSLNWFKEKESGIAFFRLQSVKQKKVLDSLNMSLEALQLSLIHEYYSYNENRKNLTIESEILYLNDALVSFKIISNSIQKNLSIKKSEQRFSLDLQNGKPLDLESVIWLDKEPKPQSDDLAKIFEYRKKVFAPYVFSELNKLYPEQMKTANCDLNKEITWALPDFVITQKGLSFYFLHSSSCNNLNWAVIPFDRLAPYLNKKYRLTVKLSNKE